MLSGEEISASSTPRLAISRRAAARRAPYSSAVKFGLGIGTGSQRGVDTVDRDPGDLDDAVRLVPGEHGRRREVEYVAVRHDAGLRRLLIDRVGDSGAAIADIDAV